MFNSLQDTITLNNQIQMPAFGLGVFKMGDGTPVKNAVRSALRYGYRLIDTAALYGNEQGVGQAINDSGIKREQLFVTSKVWNSDHGYEATLKAYDTSLKQLQMDYLDLYLIHWPVPGRYTETWKALLKLYSEKRVKAIGVSNFQIHHLQDLFAISDVMPAVNQVELHPLLAQQELRAFCLEHNIAVQAWSPLMRGRLDLPLFKELATKYGKSEANIVLRWHNQKGIAVIPKSVHDYRIRDNAAIFDFTLTDQEMARLDALHQSKRFGPDPDDPEFYASME